MNTKLVEIASVLFQSRITEFKGSLKYRNPPLQICSNPLHTRHFVANMRSVPIFLKFSNLCSSSLEHPLDLFKK